MLKVDAEGPMPPDEELVTVGAPPLPNQVRMQVYFDRVRSSYYLTHHEDVGEGIEDFVRLHDIDVLAMMPRRHSVFERLTRGSHTRRMALRAHLPLFAFPG